jgi:hypothetical protein
MNAVNREEFGELIKVLKPRLRRELRFVPEEISDWDNRDFLVVMNRSKSEGVLIFDDRRTVPFQLQKRKPNAVGRIESVICDFCSTWQRGANSAIITFSRGNSTQSFLCCGDLNCSLHVRDKTAEAKLSRVQLRESNTAHKRIQRMKIKLDRTLDY